MKIVLLGGVQEALRILTKARKGKSAESLKIAPINSIKTLLEAIRLSLWANQTEPSESISLSIRKMSLNTPLPQPQLKEHLWKSVPTHHPHNRAEAPFVPCTKTSLTGLDSNLHYQIIDFPHTPILSMILSETNHFCQINSKPFLKMQLWLGTAGHVSYLFIAGFTCLSLCAGPSWSGRKFQRMTFSKSNLVEDFIGHWLLVTSECYLRTAAFRNDILIKGKRVYGKILAGRLTSFNLIANVIRIQQ